MSEEEIASSDIYLQTEVLFESGKKYLIKANSGQGKTSVLNFIYGSNKHFEGEIFYDNIPHKTENVFSLRKTKISYVFQDLKLFPELSLLENIQIKNNLTKHKSEEEILSLVQFVHLEQKIHSPVKNLSLGQCQRVAIIRTLCQPFEVLLMDEPFSHLDSKNCDILCDMLAKELKQKNATLILTSLENNSFFDYDKMLKL